MTLTSVGPVTMEPVYSGGDRVAYEGGTTPAPQTQTADTFVPAKSAEQPKVPGAPSEEQNAEFQKTMDESIKQANKSLASYDRQIEREIHSVTKVVMYKIRDTKTNEVIAEYPPKKIQDMIAKMWELAGLFIDQKA
ncbi:flagellar protein FlaG protein [Fibrobacteres bacterium R8-0-B4]